MDLAWIFGRRRKKAASRAGVRDDPPPESELGSYTEEYAQAPYAPRSPLGEPRARRPEPPRTPVPPPRLRLPDLPAQPAAACEPAAPSAPRAGGAPSSAVVGVLIVLEGGPLDRHKLFPLRGGDNAIGRDCEHNGIVLETESVSREHAVIRAAGAGSFSLEARPSRRSPDERNPTFLNDRRIERELLSDGDTIQLGEDVRIRFRRV